MAKKWDKQRACSCAGEIASIIGRNEEIGSLLESAKESSKKLHMENWLLLEDQVGALKIELELAQGYCDLELKDAENEQKKLKQAVEQKDLDKALMSSSGLKVSVMTEVNECVSKEIMKGIKRLREKPKTYTS